ncbi:MAG TPA: LPO_1073/Vpar_1526 family protein [Stellaceae bacterium]|nr:LPO_1073/Vpar_1526 family protein [Stellaceae bacterium]
MTDQSQKVAEGGAAIQAAGSVTINTGITPTQMNEIMIGLAKQLSLYQADAERLANQRLERFRQEILNEFSKPHRANAEAFKDPDFQYLLNRAQHAYARIGDEQVGDTLVQMIAERSQCADRNRVSLVLNQAVETVAVLTENEFAELGLLFLMAQTRNNRINNLAAFKVYVETLISPLLDNVSLENSSYAYLVAQQCISINFVGSIPLERLLIGNYGGIFCDGFALEEVKSHIGNDDEKFALVMRHLMPCLNDSNKLQFKAINSDLAKEQLDKSGLDQSATQNLVNLFSAKMWNGQKLIEKLKPTIPDYERLAKIWSETPLHQSTPTALGTAIGHATLRRLDPDFGAISIWIR